MAGLVPAAPPQAITGMPGGDGVTPIPITQSPTIEALLRDQNEKLDVMIGLLTQILEKR